MTDLETKMREIFYENYFCESDCSARDIKSLTTDFGTGGKTNEYVLVKKNPCWCGGESKREQVISQLLSLIQEREKEAENREAKYYSEKYKFQEYRAFDKFLKILHGVLISKTDPRLIQQILEDVMEDYKKLTP